jgi:hypothetical protein
MGRRGNIRKGTGKRVRKSTGGVAPGKYGPTYERSHGGELARDEPELDGVADQPGGAVRPQRSHYLVFVGLNSACGQL